MLSAEQNDRIPRTGPDAPAGALLRRYWQPAALVDELSGNRPVKPVKLMGENLVIFRDERGRYGLIGRACPHRGTDLAYGRLEDGGLRCAFHGWLFDVTGRCLQAPAEPDGSNLCANIRQKAYPVVERSGILFAYLGPGEPPAHRVPTRRFLRKREWYASEIFIEGLDLEPVPGHFVTRVRDERANHRIGTIQGIDGRDHPRLESRESIEHSRNEHIAGETAGKIEVQIQLRLI